MATVTLTETLQPTEPVVLRLLNQDNRDLIDRLAGILDNFRDETDVLSKRMFKWGADVLVLTAECNDITIEEFHRVASERIKDLQETILVDSLTNQPLESPMLNRGWTLDQSTIDEIPTDPKISPLDGEIIEARVHKFALEMINWVNSVKQTNSTQEAGPSNEMVPITNSSQLQALQNASDEVKPFLFLVLAQKAHAIRSHHIVQQALNQQTESFKELNEEMQETFAEEAERMQQRQQESERIIRERIAQLDETHNREVESLNAQMGSLEGRVQIRDQDLVDTRSEIASRGREINRLLAQNAAAQREIQRLADEGGGGGCIIL